MLKLELQFFSLFTDVNNRLICKDPDGKIDGRRRRGQQRMIWLHDITNSMEMSLSILWELLMDREVQQTAVHGIAQSWTKLND